MADVLLNLSRWHVIMIRVYGILVLMCSALGCGTSTINPPEVDDMPLRLLGRLYGEHMAANNGVAPADEAQLVAHLEKSADLLRSQGIAEPRELLMSPRDRKPLVVYYGKEVIHDGPGGFPLVAVESEGVDGKKLTVGVRGNVEEMTSEQIEAFTSR